MSQEDENPPEFGNVFLSVKPKTQYYLTDYEKKYISGDDLLGKYKIMNITVNIVNPDYIFIKPEITARYDPNISLNQEQTIINNIKDSISSYTKSYLNYFDKDFRNSKLSAQVDASDDAIKSNDLTMKLKKHILLFVKVCQKIQNQFKYLKKMLLNGK